MKLKINGTADIFLNNNLTLKYKGLFETTVTECFKVLEQALLDNLTKGEYIEWHKYVRIIDNKLVMGEFHPRNDEFVAYKTIRKLSENEIQLYNSLNNLYKALYEQGSPHSNISES